MFSRNLLELNVNVIARMFAVCNAPSRNGISKENNIS